MVNDWLTFSRSLRQGRREDRYVAVVSKENLIEALRLGKS
jgi:hypothetical protein